ncbi:uncharacterized protein E5676_scaffold295G00220 [Cucumis melo var. makuwa]|uniref:Integrase catalytic domain-containing protein n=1 Tax=Cucumis melo var. makuwa TaxID=1194695 RepID=A0A5A7V087_CUCMM|nr:uncharacterized protein E6C27_scaffold430G001490 [Cucumis melo var. makuwa]TYK19303.1 uncharacterized protein E5676_scaffold295G00220 [Cucumis melo var. makuwa]
MCHPQTRGQTESVNRKMVFMLRALLDNITKAWEDFLPFNGFAYNSVIHSIIDCSSFEIVYGFNLLTPIDLLSFSSNDVVNFQGNEKTTTIRELHKEVKERIEKQNAKVANKVDQH